MIPKKLHCLIVCLMPLIYPNWALSHSFNLVFIAPSSAQQAESIERGLRLAAREQDAHAFEESDGHLGGLDVYLIRIDASRTHDERQRIVRESQPLFAYGVEFDADARAMLERASVIPIEPERARFWATIERAPRALTRFDGSAFVDGYRSAHGGEPDAAALRAYVAARVVAAVVRESSERDRGRPERLRAILQRVMERSRL